MKPVPQEIRAKGHELSLRWSDGHESRYETRDLRLACRCAACVDEWTHESLLKTAQVPPSVEPKSIDVVGHYALQFFWSDGHHTGIYTYDYLRELCSCEDCRGKRSFNV